MSLINVSVNLFNPSASFKPFGTRGAGLAAPLGGSFLTDNAIQGGGPHPMAGEFRESDSEGARPVSERPVRPC